MITINNLVINNKTESIALSKTIATYIKAKTIIAFLGDLGSGKTFFCRHIIKEICGKKTQVSSPTYNLLNTYYRENFIIYHFDLYRLNHYTEIYELGFEQALNNQVILIEWPEIILHLLPNNTTFFNIQKASNNKRKITITTK